MDYLYFKVFSKPNLLIFFSLEYVLHLEKLVPICCCRREGFGVIVCKDLGNRFHCPVSFK